MFVIGVVVSKDWLRKKFLQTGVKAAETLLAGLVFAFVAIVGFLLGLFQFKVLAMLWSRL